MNMTLLANTHPVTQAALALLLRTRLHDAEIWTAAHWYELLTLVEKRRPGVILLDGDLPGCTTAQGLALLRKIHPGVKVLLLGTQMDTATNNMTIFVSCPEPPERLLEMVRQHRPG
jgi:DNA-binding NarL/FixJ family response regulator